MTNFNITDTLLNELYKDLVKSEGKVDRICNHVGIPTIGAGYAELMNRIF